MSTLPIIMHMRMLPASHAIHVAVPLLCALFAADRLCHNVQMVDLSTNAITLVAGSTTCNSGNCTEEGGSALGNCLNDPRGIEVSRSVEPSLCPTQVTGAGWGVHACAIRPCHP